MAKFRLNTMLGRGISWPAKCIVCGDINTTTAHTKCSMVTRASYRVIYWGWTSRTISIIYPICWKHKVLCFLPSLLSRRSLFNIGVGFVLFVIIFVLLLWLIIPLVMFFLEGIPLEYDITALYILCLIMAVISAFIVVKVWTPVKLYGADNESITLSINNETYANEFEALNKEIIV